MGSISERNNLLDEDVEKTEFSDFKSASSRSRNQLRKDVFLGVLLVLSLCTNVFLIFKNSTLLKAPDTQCMSNVTQQEPQAPKTKFAKLTWNTPSEFTHDNIYTDRNESIARAAWDALNYDLGSIHLPADEAKELGLPEAQEFPWDNSDRMYFLNGHHSLHCLKAIHRTLFELRDGQPLGYDFRHTLHCVDSLRQDVMCFADDTPRHVVNSEGEKQQRMCRSWDQLEEWALERTTCWRDINPTEDIDTLLRYRYCPEGSPYNARIKAIFGEFDKGPNASATT